MKTVVVLIFAFIPLIFGDETDKDKVFSECLSELSINEGKSVTKMCQLFGYCGFN